MSPLDSLSALSQLQLPTSASAIAPNLAATGTTNPISEGFQQILQPALNATPLTSSLPDVSTGSVAGPGTWGHMLQQMVLDVNAKQTTASQKVSDVLQGGPTPVHEAMVATEEASLSFEFLAEMRNKVVESYQTIMQMQV